MTNSRPYANDSRPYNVKGEKVSVLIVEDPSGDWKVYSWDYIVPQRATILDLAQGRPWTFFENALATDDSAVRCEKCGQELQ